jgi:hypothetical protein
MRAELGTLHAERVTHLAPIEIGVETGPNAADERSISFGNGKTIRGGLDQVVLVAFDEGLCQAILPL